MNLQIQNILAALPDGVKTVTVSVSDGIIVGIELGFLTNNVNMIPITILEITISEFIVIMIIGLPIYNKLIKAIKDNQK